MTPRRQGGTLGLWREIFCFVRNGYSIEVPINSPIFKLLFKNQAAFAENHFENIFQTKQSSLSTFYETEVSEQL
jgi:hypothetical protein